MNTADAAKLLLSRLGLPYVWGANGPDKMDCSGLVYWWMNATGNKRTDTTAAGLYDRTTAIKTPKFGDLAFLHSGGYISHVGVHLDADTIIEARGRAYGVVKTPFANFKARPGYKFMGSRRDTKLLFDAAPEPTPTGAAFWTTTYNCEDPRFGGHTSDDASVLTKASASVYLLTECPEKVRDYIRSRMSGGASRWLVWTRADSLPQAIMFDSEKYSHTKSTAVTFGPTSYHGAVIAVLTRKDADRQIQFATLHLPASKQASDAQRKAFFNKLLKALDKKIPAVIGGDFNTAAAASWLKAEGFSVSQTGATTDHGARYDFVACRGGIVDKAETYNPGPASDHFAVRAHITIGA